MFKDQCKATLNILLLIVIIIATTNKTAWADDERKNRQRFEQLSAESTQLKQLLAQFKSKRSRLQTQLQKSETDIGSIQKKTRQIIAKLQQEKDELDNLQSKRKTLQQQKQQQQQLISKQIVAAYQVGKQKKIKILLNQEQPDKVSRALTYYDYFNQARSEQITNFSNIVEELNQLEPQILSRTQSLSLIKSRLDNEHKNLTIKKQAREINLSNINASITTSDQKLRQNTKDRAELEQLLEAVEKSLANITIPSNYKPFTSRRGKLPWPVKGRISGRFGSLRSDGGQRWQGVKIQAKEGSQVQAIHHGRIVFADWFRGSGLLVIVDHGDGYMSLYAHNQSILKETGEWITSGETIATVGNSGGQKRASLYFEIRHNGKPANPAKWCKRA